MHKLSERELDPSSSSSEQEDLSDYTPVYRQPLKPVKANIGATKFKAPLDKQNDCAVSPCKAELAKVAPEAPNAPKVDAAPLAKQLVPTKKEGPGLGSKLSSAPIVAKKNNKSKKASLSLWRPYWLQRIQRELPNALRNEYSCKGSEFKVLY